MRCSMQLLDLRIMFEVLMAGHLIAWPLSRRRRFPIRLMSSSICCMAAMALIPISDNLSPSSGPVPPVVSGTLVYVFAAMLLYAALHHCYAARRSTMLFCVVSGYTIQHLLSAMNSTFSYSGLYERFPESEPFIYLALAACVGFGCYATLCRGIRKLGTIIVENRAMVALSFIAVFVDIIIGIYVLYMSKNAYQREYLTLLSIYDVVVCLFLLHVMFDLAVNRSLRLKNQTMARLIDEQRERYAFSARTIERVNIKCHDLKHQVHHLASNATGVDDRLLSNLERTIDDYDSIFNTGCDALDVVLDEKHSICVKRGIELACMADGTSLKDLAPDDVYVLFGNILDNAIEAQESVQPENERYIILTVKATGKMLVIHEENRMSGKLRYQDGLPMTTKKNENMDHGFGTRSIRHIAATYDGALSMTDKDGWFMLDIAIPLSK